MTIILDKLIDFNGTVFRNINRVQETFDAFDDLSADPKARDYAHQLSESPKQFGANDLLYHAIDYIYQQTSWQPTRFGLGAYPVWYGSLDLTTSFHETLYHWQKRFIQAPQGFNQLTAGLIIANRAVFKVICRAALIDLRNKVTENPELVDPDPVQYALTQEIGNRIFEEGHPGLISQSARFPVGENIAVFRRSVLSAPVQFNDYLYEFDPRSGKSAVKELKTNKVVLVA